MSPSPSFAAAAGSDERRQAGAAGSVDESVGTASSGGWAGAAAVRPALRVALTAPCCLPSCAAAGTGVVVVSSARLEEGVSEGSGEEGEADVGGWGRRCRHSVRCTSRVGDGGGHGRSRS